jgi:hypothetical protein
MMMMTMMMMTTTTTMICRNDQEDKLNILWYQKVQTERIIRNSRLDVIIHNNETGTCMLLHAANSGEKNVIKKKPSIF